MQKKVLLAITKSGWGGAQLYVNTLAHALKKTGVSVTVLTGEASTQATNSDSLLQSLATDDIQVIQLPSLTRDISLLTEFKTFCTLIRVFREERPEVVHLNSSKIGGMGALAARVAGVQTIIFTAHGWAHREPRPLLVRTVIWLLSFCTIALCSKVIVVSERDLKDAPALFMRSKLVCIPNGIQPFELLSRSEARTNLHISEDAFVLLLIGELHKNKGQDVALAALSELTVKNPSVLLVCIGGGEERDALKYASEGLPVHFTGFLENARSYLAAADVFLMPSRKEGLPFALLEAGIARLAVVASRTGGIPELIKDGVTGILVPPENPQALADALDTLIQETALRTRFGDALHAHVTDKYSESSMIRETFRVYGTE